MVFCDQPTILLLITLCTQLPYLAVGGAVGLTGAIAGAVVDFRRAQASDNGEARLPGCMLLMAGALGGAGALALLLSFFVSGIGRALAMGVGVGVGFFGGFLALAVLWLLWGRLRA